MPGADDWRVAHPEGEGGSGGVGVSCRGVRGAVEWESVVEESSVSSDVESE